MLESFLGVTAVVVGVLLGLQVSPVGGLIGGGAAAFAALEVMRRRKPRHLELPAAGDAHASSARAESEVAAADSSPQGSEALALLDRVSDALLVLDADQNILLANPAAALLLAPEGGAVVGGSLLRAAWSSELARVVRAATGLPQELALAGARTLLATAFPLAGDTPRTGLILTEVSAARRADRSRSELVANLSHELRTPIAAARALAETLEGGVDDDERRERYQHQLLAELDRLAAIIDRTLHLSRIEAGAEPLELAAHDAGRLLRAAVQRVAPLVEAGGFQLRLVVEPGLPAVLADFDRVTEVVTILLDNALKFSPPGGEIVASAVAGAGSAAGFVTFEVRDHGPGILPGERERVFERLYTGDPARSVLGGERTGFGLGLAIARHIVAWHGGRIWVEDGPGPGAAFRFTLPEAPTEASPEAS